MSHGRACEESTSTRCRCSCATTGHGTIGAPLYRSLAESHHSSAHFVPTGKYADAAVDVLAEVIQRSPRDADQLYEAVQQVVSENAWKLLFDKGPRGQRVGRKHWLCQMLAEAAEMLDQLADIGGTVEDAVRDEAALPDGERSAARPPASR